VAWVVRKGPRESTRGSDRRGRWVVGWWFSGGSERRPAGASPPAASPVEVAGSAGRSARDLESAQEPGRSPGSAAERVRGCSVVGGSRWAGVARGPEAGLRSEGLRSGWGRDKAACPERRTGPPRRSRSRPPRPASKRFGNELSSWASPTTGPPPRATGPHLAYRPSGGLDPKVSDGCPEMDGPNVDSNRVDGSISSGTCSFRIKPGAFLPDWFRRIDGRSSWGLP